MNTEKNLKTRKGICGRCGNVFDATPHLKLSVENPISDIRPIGETRNGIEDSNMANMSVKCPYCGYEYSEELKF